MTKLDMAIFAGGCFWCTEAVFKRLKGVESVTPGYSGGDMPEPDYEEVSSGRTGHAEAIRVEFDPAVIKYDDLLSVFFAMHDPTTLNQQGADVGTQYRSAIFYTGEEQKTQAQAFIKKLDDDKVFEQPIVTEVRPAGKFYKAEDYHLDYYAKNQNKPYCMVVINPKIAKLRQKFASLLKPE